MTGRPVLPGRHLGRAALLVSLGLGLLLGCVFVVPPLLVPVDRPASADVAPVDRLRLENERVKLRNDARGTLLQAFGATFFLVTALLSWRQIQVSREGQITDRFSRAIEHLGTDDKLEVRLGGIYALERIAHDSAREQGAIMEILTAYVRRHAGRTASAPSGGSADQPAEPLPLRARAPDVQAVMTVLGRRPPSDVDLLQLAAVDLRMASLPDANLQGANLAGADLSGIDLRRADLRGADLRDAELRLADLTAANLSGANLDHANLRGTRLNRGNLNRARLADANLGEARLQGATLRNTQLKQTNLWGAALVGVDLRGASLEGSTLVGANLGDAILDGATLAGATLDGVDLAGARADRATAWPAGFDWRSAGVTVRKGSADSRTPSPLPGPP